MKSHEVLNARIRLTEALAGDALPGYLNFLGKQEELGKVIDISEFATMALERSETLWPTAELTDKIIETAEAYPEDVPVEARQLPNIPYGLAVLDKPLITTDSLGREEIMHMVTWGIILTVDSQSVEKERNPVVCYHVVMWNDARRQPDGGARDQAATWRKQGKDLTHDIRQLFPIRSFVFAFEHTTVGPMWANIPADIRARDEAEGFRPPEKAISTGRCLLALFDLMNRVPEPKEGDDTSAVTVGKSALRHAARAKVPPAIRVVPFHSALARREPDPDRAKRTRAPVDHRVVVREHTRMQAYGPGRTLRREITIRSYEYGPEDPPGTEPPPRIYRVG